MQYTLSLTQRLQGAPPSDLRHIEKNNLIDLPTVVDLYLKRSGQIEAVAFLMGGGVELLNEGRLRKMGVYQIDDLNKLEQLEYHGESE